MLLDSFVHTPMDFQMIQLAKEWRNRYQIGLISDNKCDRIEAVLLHYGLQSLFDVVAVSAAAGSGKAQRTIFEYAMRAVDAEADECLFIDLQSEI